MSSIVANETLADTATAERRLPRENTMRQTRLSRRQIVTAGAALGAGLLTAPAGHAQPLEKITYLFPAPPVLPAFGPIRLAQGKGYFKEAGLDGRAGPLEKTLDRTTTRLNHRQ